MTAFKQFVTVCCALQTVQSFGFWLCVKHLKLEMWANANVMAALPNIGGALCSTPQSLADAHY